MKATPQIHQTGAGTRYLKDAGVVLIAKTRIVDGYMRALRQFMLDLDPEFDVGSEDWTNQRIDTNAQEGALLTQYAGQLCYLSFGTARTPFAENETYLRRILSSGHGSVLEHVSYTMLFYGVDRACTHELVQIGRAHV